MTKINKIVSLLLLMSLQISAFSQYANLPIQNQKDYNVLIKKIQRKYKCSQWFSKKDTRLIVIFKLQAVAPISKKEFIDGSFLKKLEYTCAHNYKYRFRARDLHPFLKPIPFGRIGIYSKEKVVAIFPYEYMKFVEFKKFDKKYYEKILKERFYQNKSYEEYCEIRKSTTSTIKARSDALRNYIWDKGKLFIFQLEENQYDNYFIINEQLEIFVFFNESDEGYSYKVLPIKEFMDKYWDRFSKKNGSRLTG